MMKSFSLVAVIAWISVASSSMALAGSEPPSMLAECIAPQGGLILRFFIEPSRPKALELSVYEVRTRSDSFWMLRFPGSYGRLPGLELRQTVVRQSRGLPADPVNLTMLTHHRIPEYDLVLDFAAPDGKNYVVFDQEIFEMTCTAPEL
jgi:hypothetical protein